MKKTFLIFTHELGVTVKRSSFIVFTLLVPLLALLAIGVVKLATASPSSRAPSHELLGYVDELGSLRGFTEQGSVTFRRFDAVEEANRSLVNGEIKEYLVVPSDYMSTMTISRFISRKEFIPSQTITDAVRHFISRNLLSGKASPETIRVIETPVMMITTKLAPDGSIAADQGGVGNAILPLVFCLLLVLSLLFSSGYLLQGLVEEKENRLMEVLVCRVSPQELLMGKVLGLGTAGVVQVLVWLITLPLILWLGQSLVGGIFTTIHVPVCFYFLALLFFLLSFLLFSTLSASVGAISSNAREGGQLSALFSMFPVVPLWLMSLFMAFPQHPVWAALSAFPLTAPVMVIERLSITDVPAWQIVTSLAMLALFAIGGLFLSTRIFRTCLLMYGKRPGLGKVLRSVFTN
jgi:ABC-2 type transport system permease protein